MIQTCLRQANFNTKPIYNDALRLFNRRSCSPKSASSQTALTKTQRPLHSTKPERQQSSNLKRSMTTDSSSKHSIRALPYRPLIPAHSFFTQLLTKSLSGCLPDSSYSLYCYYFCDCQLPFLSRAFLPTSCSTLHSCQA